MAGILQLHVHINRELSRILTARLAKTQRPVYPLTDVNNIGSAMPKFTYRSRKCNGSLRAQVASVMFCT